MSENKLKSNRIEKIDASGEAELLDIVEIIANMRRAPAGLESLTSLLVYAPDKLPRDARIDYLAAIEKQCAWLSSVRQEAILAVAGLEVDQVEFEYGGLLNDPD